MNQFLAAILATLYLGTSIGATVHMHYCMGRLVECGLRGTKSSICSRCGMEKKSEASKDCCKDECKRVKIDNDQNLSPGSLISGVIPQVGSVIYSGYTGSLLHALSGNFQQSNGPPLRGDSLYIIHCVFRI